MERYIYIGFLPKEGEVVKIGFNDLEGLAIVKNLDIKRFCNLEYYAIVWWDKNDKSKIDSLYNGFYCCPFIGEADYDDYKKIYSIIKNDGYIWKEDTKELIFNEEMKKGEN